jgi:hypothetical protein
VPRLLQDLGGVDMGDGFFELLVADVGRPAWPATSAVKDDADLDSRTEGINPGTRANFASTE